MFERFTERARQVVVFAQDEARLLGHDYIGTEHLLLGVLREPDGIGGGILRSFGIELEAVRAEVARTVGRSAGVPSGEMPFTKRAKKSLESGLREALDMGHRYIGTEHVLLGLATEADGIAAQILAGFEADAARIRTEVIRVLSGAGVPPRGRATFEIGAHAAGTDHQLVIGCPRCGMPLETITTDQPNTRFDVSAEGDRTCGSCGRTWTIAYAVSWKERPA